MTIPSDPEAIRTLAHILRDTGLTEIEIVSGDARLRLVRAAAPVQSARRCNRSVSARVTTCSVPCPMC